MIKRHPSPTYKLNTVGTEQESVVANQRRLCPAMNTNRLNDDDNDYDEQSEQFSYFNIFTQNSYIMRILSNDWRVTICSYCSISVHFTLEEICSVHYKTQMSLLWRIISNKALHTVPWVSVGSFLIEIWEIIILKNIGPKLFIRVNNLAVYAFVKSVVSLTKMHVIKRQNVVDNGRELCQTMIVPTQPIRSHQKTRLETH